MPRALQGVLVGMLVGAATLASATRVAARDAPKEPESSADQPQTKAEERAPEPTAAELEAKESSVRGGPKGEAQSVAVDLQRLGTQLNLYAAEANRARLAAALTGLGVGAALVPSGLILLGRTDGVSQALVIGMIVGGSAQLLSVPLQLIPTRMDEIRDDFMARPANEESKATIRAIETEWRLTAESKRRKRALVGTTLLIVGTVSLATSLTLLLAPEGVLGMSRNTQYMVGGVMLGIGVPVTTLSVRMLLEWSLEETSWEAYRAMKSDAGSLGRLRAPSLGVVPTPSGAVAFATMPF
jgi:hypothetical protein